MIQHHLAFFFRRSPKLENYIICDTPSLIRSEQVIKCQICGNSNDNTKYRVKEMMLGLREEFIYFLCNRCRCLQIEEIPNNIGKYYANDRYYSLSPQRNRKLVSILTKPSFYQKGILYKILQHYLMLDNALFSVGKLNLPRDSRILDVGSGYGDLLIKLKKLGYSNLIGIDPFIDYGIDYNDQSVKIRKVPIDKLDEKEGFNLVMFHHSFEHVPNPLEELLYAKKHLKKNGIILIRTPVISYAFEKYRSNWYQIDAPRHFFIYSINAMKTVIDKVGLILKDIYFDSLRINLLGQKDTLII